VPPSTLFVISSWGAIITTVERTQEVNSTLPRFGSVRLLVGAAAVAVVTIIVVYFHDRFWWAPDDGAYAYIAQRLLHGDVLSADVQDIHPGYVHFIHAAAMGIFGEDVVSLRYPLALLTVLQAAIVYLLLLSRGTMAAFAGSMATGALSFVQFLNPSANWYVLFVAFAVIACLYWLKPGLTRYFIVGFLLALAFLLRQLSGIFLAMGAIAWLLSQPVAAECRERSWLARGTLFLIAAGLSGYLISKGSAAVIIMFGIWPLAALVVIWRHLRISDREVAVMFGTLGMGATLATLPLLIYLLYHGSFAAWLDDVVVVALRLNGLSFLSQPSFAALFVHTVGSVVANPTAGRLSSGMFWLALVALPIISGLVLWKRASEGLDPHQWHPATVIAVFFAPASAHYQIPLYLTYTSCLTLVGLFFLLRSQTAVRAIAAMSMVLSTVGLLQHAGQPLSRGFHGIIRGDTVTLDVLHGIPRASVAMEQRDAQVYGEIVAVINRYAGPDERILTLPFIPEFYFLSGRQSAVRFLGVPFGIGDEAQLVATIEKLSANPPRVVINKREDKYHSPLSMKLLGWIARRFEFLKAVGDFDVYVASPRNAGFCASSVLPLPPQQTDVDHRCPHSLKMPINPGGEPVKTELERKQMKTTLLNDIEAFVLEGTAKAAPSAEVLKSIKWPKLCHGGHFHHRPPQQVWGADCQKSAALQNSGHL